MAKGRDKELMKELLKYPAKVFFRDHTITVFQTEDPASYCHYTEGLRYHNGNDEDITEYIVRTRNKDVLVFRYDRRSYTFRSSIFSIVASRHSTGPAKLPLSTWVRKYPSLYTAFESIAMEVLFLPLIKNPTDEIVRQALHKDASQIVNVPKLSKGRLKRLLGEFPDCIRHVPENMQDTSLANYIIDKHGGDYLRDIKKVLRDEKLCLKAVRSDAMAIRDCPYQTERLKIEAARRDGRSLKYIKDPSFVVKRAAVKSHPDAWEYITDEKERKKLKKAK